ncbi:MAG: hypothetical protein JO241_01055 [Candidatus Eremiobacteraeota bacterium]|nr:hypothetical protein [Candidatus Eremiobacteraeota bacterium]
MLAFFGYPDCPGMADGHTISMLVNDKAHLAGLKAGDVVQITYTQALAITVQ